MEEKVIKLVSDATKIDIAKISKGTSFVDDLNLDSLDIVELMMKMEDVNFTATRPHLKMKGSCFHGQCWSLSYFASQCLQESCRECSGGCVLTMQNPKRLRPLGQKHHDRKRHDR